MFDDPTNQPESDESPKRPIPEIETLVGFFDLLISVDRRINPHLYDRHSLPNAAKTTHHTSR